MAETPPTPRPGRGKAAKKGSRGPVTTDAPDTPPDRDAPPVDLAAAAAAAAADARAADRPPRTASASRSRPTQADKLQASLEELLSLPALAYKAAGDDWGAEFFAERAPVMAEAWVDLGKENPAVMRVLRKLTTTSAWGGVILATGGTVLPVLIHHDLIPDLGIPLPGPSGEAAPLVPPPSGPPPTPPGGATTGPVVGRRPPPPGGHTDMTPPLKPDQPPGVVTVAGGNNQAR